MPRKRQSLAAHLAPYKIKPEPRPRQEGAWVAQGLLRRGEITLLVGKPKDGKTCLAATLATAVARGEPFAGLDTERTNVLYLAAEESPDEWEHALHPYLSRVDPRRLAVVYASFAIDHGPTLDAIERKVEADAVGLVVVDPLFAALGANDITGFPGARSALLGLRSLCRRADVAALVLHHAHGRLDQAVSPAGHPILATIARRTFVLNHTPHPKGRLVALRGADRPLRLLSLNPGHYAAEKGSSSTAQPRKGSRSAEK